MDACNARLWHFFYFTGGFMAEYDGSIRINTNINTDGIVRGMGEIRQAIERGMSASKPMQNTEQEVKQLGDSMSATAQKASELKNVMKLPKNAQVPTKEYSDLEKEVNSLEKKLLSVYDRQEKFLAIGGKEDSSTYKRMVYDAETLESKLQKAEQAMEALVSSGKAFTVGTDSDAEYWKQQEENIDRIIARLEEKRQKEAETPPELLQPRYDRPEVESWQRGVGLQEGLREAQALADAMASIGQNVQDSATKSNEAIASMTQELTELKARQKELEKSGKGLGFEEYDKNVQRIAEINAALKTYQRELINASSVNTQSSYERLNQALGELVSKLNSVISPIQKMKAEFAQNVDISGYDKLDSTLFGLRDTAMQASQAVRNAFATLREDPLSVVHVLANGLMNLATTINSNVIGALNVVGEKIGFVWGVIMSVTFKTVDAIKEKMAGFANFALNTLFHPIQTLKNVASPIIRGFGNVFKFAIEKAKSAAAGFAASIINGILHPIQTLKSASNNLENIIKKFGGVAKNVFSSLNGLAKKLDNGLKKLTKTIIGLFTHTKKTANSNNNILKTGFKNILKYGLGIRSLYVLVNKIRTGIKEGFSNFANYSSSFKSSIDSLKGSMLTLKNAFAAAFSPLVEIAIPYIQRVIDYLVKLMDVIGQVMAALTGQKNYTRAIKQTTGAIKEQNKAQNKQLSSLDKLNNSSSDKKGGSDNSGAANMFEEAPIENRWKEMAEKLKKIGQDFFKPIKEAWNKDGKFVMDSWNRALNKVGKLVKDVGKDFLQAWNQSETIAMFQDIFHVVGDIGLVGGNLAQKFREAWNANNIGLHTFENARDILAVIINNIRLAADYTVAWSNKLDFYPLLSKIEEWTNSLIPVFDALSGIVMDFYTMVLLPLAQWTLEKGLPDLLQVFIDFNDKVDWEGLRERLAEFWKHVEPFAETIGQGLIIFIDRISNALANFVNSPALDSFLTSIENWMDNVEPEDVANALEKLAIALISIKVAVMGFSAISAVLPIFKSLASILGLFGPAGIAVGALALASFLSKTIEDVDMGKVGQAVGNAVIKLVDFIGQAFSEINWYMLGQKVVDFIAGIDWIGLFTSLVEALAGILGNVISGAIALSAALSEGIANLIINAVDAAKEYFQGKIEEAGGSIVLGILKGIVDGIAGIGNWIVEHIFTPFIDGFKNAFGIHSPSTVMAEMGTYIIQGLLNGITSLVDKVKETWASMKETALEVWENVKTGLAEKWENTKETAVTKWNEIKETLGTTWDNMKTKAETNFTAIKDYIKDKWNDTENDTDSTWERIKETIDSITSDVKGVISSKFSEIVHSFGGFSADAQSSWARTWESMQNKLGTILNSIKDKIGSVFNWISEKLGSVGSAISGVFSGGASAATYSSASSYSAMPQIAALSKMEFPGYATGQVIPTSMKKHLAWLGDNNHETEVVSPLSTIEKAVENVIARAGGIGSGKATIEIPLVVDGRELTRVVQNYDLQAFNSRGLGLFEH